MILIGCQRIEASREVVWAALNDPAVLMECIPGCTELDKTSDLEMTATSTLKVGPMKITFSGRVSFSDIDPPHGYSIAGEGNGGMAGFAKGKAAVRLEEADGMTLLHYEARSEVGGKLAQLGARLIDSTAKKYTKDFFEKFGTVAGRLAAKASANRNSDKQ
jgi:carbon monoxide dehydrogenase subunit G